MRFGICEICGASLDPNERCDCQTEIKPEIKQSAKPDSDYSSIPLKK